MKILKFGGKSLDTYEKVQNICKNIKKIYKNDKKIIIIVSAFGNTTNELDSLAKLFSGGKESERERAMLLSTGEIQSACLFSMSLKRLNVPAKSFTGKDINLRTFGGYNSGIISYLDKSKLIETIESGIVAVVCGYQGVNKLGEVTTLGKGGSDTTAVAISAAFDCPVEIYSDYEGVFAGDPKFLPFKKFDNIDYNTMLTLSNSGAKVLSSSAVKLARDREVKIIAKSSSSFEGEKSEVSKLGENIIAISAKTNMCKISIVFNNQDNLTLISKFITHALKNINFQNYEISQNNISFFIEEENFSSVYSSLSKKLKLLKN